jgi:hypothetical protein
LNSRLAFAEVITPVLGLARLLFNPPFALGIVPRQRVENAVAVAILFLAIEPVLAVDAELAPILVRLVRKFGLLVMVLLVRLLHLGLQRLAAPSPVVDSAETTPSTAIPIQLSVG